MAKCIRCGEESLRGTKICPSCISKWSDMRVSIFNTLQNKYGKLSKDNQTIFIKITKRLESIWRMDKIKFQHELDKLSNS
jgi:hypothetical protein